MRLNATSGHFAADHMKLDLDLVELAGLAHDLGHPPFGHNGEYALDKCMADHGGFEGNAQTLRILSRLEKKETRNGGYAPLSEGRDVRLGLNLTFRSLASILKYDAIIPVRKSDRTHDDVVKGYYEEDRALVAAIKNQVLGEAFAEKFKTVECSIMDIADDIAYSTYDLEDVFKSGVLKPLDLFALDDATYDEVVATINARLAKQYADAPGDPVDREDVRSILFFLMFDLFEVGENQKKLLASRSFSREAKKMLLAAEVQEISKKVAEDGYYRTALTSGLVQHFLDGVEVVAHDRFPQLHRVRLERDTFIVVEVLKNITYTAVIRSPIMQIVEYRGKDILGKIFNALIDDRGSRLLPKDFRELYENGNEMQRYRTVCDFIAGMTDRYALEFYSRLFGEQGLTMHKPL